MGKEEPQATKETSLSPQAKQEVITVLTNVCHCFRKATLNHGHAWAMDHDDDAIHKVSAAASLLRFR